MQDIAGRRILEEVRPNLDIALQRAELIRQLPLFADLDEAAQKRLGRALKTRYVNADDVVVRKDSPARNVFFIASGAVELVTARQTLLLGRGEMFGQMAVLSKKNPRAMVRAIAPSTFLVLDETRFRRLLERSKSLRDAVRASAEKRGIPPSQIMPEAAE
jgi:CPA1 family monovalent cation:H+ antiporter